MKLNKEEADILRSYKTGEWDSVDDVKKETERFQAYARTTFKKDRRVNIRISSKDLEGIQKRALEEGMPYQTLITSVIHKYVSGRLVERNRINNGDDNASLV